MKIHLPNKNTSKLGFTLIELLVVISIIAILAVIGMTIFSGIQPRSRDAARKADIEAISRAMEVGYVETTGQYAALATTMFSTGVIPVDPLTGNNCQSNVCKYCVRAASGNCVAADTTVAAGAPAAGATYRVCANLEQGAPTFICRANQR